MRIFDMEGPVFTGLTKIFDLLLLNIIYIVCCLPIITIGAATTALHYTNIHQVNNQDYLVKTFFKAFKANFVQSTLVWIPMGICYVVLLMNISSMSAVLKGNILLVLFIGNIIVFVLFAFFATLVCPLLAKFENTTKNTLKNACLISIRSMPWTLLCAILWNLPLIAFFFNMYYAIYVLMFWIFFGFSGSSYFMALIYEKKVFSRYID